MEEWYALRPTTSKNLVETPMSIQKKKCDGCDAIFDLAVMVDQYVVLLHGYHLTDRKRFCPAYAKVEEERRCGGVDQGALENIKLALRLSVPAMSRPKPRLN